MPYLIDRHLLYQDYFFIVFLSVLYSGVCSTVVSDGITYDNIAVVNDPSVSGFYCRLIVDTGKLVRNQEAVI